MKITNIEAFPVKLKLKEPFVISSVINDDMFYVILKLSTDEGIFGYGEAIPAWEVTGETLLGVIDVINYFMDSAKTGINLIGKNISTLEKIKQLIYTINPHSGIQAVWGAPSAKAAIEEAVLDAYGKYINLPVYKIFGGKNKKIPFNNVISIYPVSKTLEIIDKELEKGAGIIKLKVGIKDIDGLPGFERDIAVIKEAKKLIDKKAPNVKIVADANQGFIDVENTLDVLKKVDGCLYWLEQPILSDDKLGFAEIKKKSDVKLMADESIHNYHDALLMLKLKAVDYINIKLMKSGGLLGAHQIADIAEQFEVPCQMGSMLENQIGTAIAAHAYLSHDNIMSAEIGTHQRLRECIGSGIVSGDNYIEIPDKPGVGIDVNDDDIRKNLISEADSRTYKTLRHGL